MNAKTRQQVLERDGFRCRDCGYDQEAEIAKQLKAGARDRKQAIRWAGEELTGFWGCTHLLQVDHKHAKALGGSDEVENLETLCLRCHRAKSGRDDAPLIAKGRRLRKANAEHAEKMKEKAGG